ncbi:PepSY-associated TM helix domain-containing protein [Cyclobacterium jeungdonense]|uniref:PepSY-associated TM helix domain-containing protein n=1 Tax=Cyclobacterium jeungdonense TaxID=708087 RepID=A0ABT8CAT1_9BACT|nr:PepSY-associated TM helix domain-containing protein [Cyclobacterium jeungdonense]MDN3689615.1 PepSY-associated TM helix domain-containing protein [Cyclobacterium jeungdonense]
MRLKKYIRKMHLWLGLSSGLVVFIVAVTGCLYAFQSEIQDLLQPYRFVTPQETAVLPPSKIWEAADEALPGKHLHAVLYPTAERAAMAIYYSFEEHYYYFVYVNPYTGMVQKVKDEYADFFRIILDGHFYLWLPPEIGQPVVASFTLVFLVMVLSGLVLWWPKKKVNLKQALKIRWNARWRRKNYDLHRVLGFYVMVFALIFALTGLVWGFSWFRDAVFYTTTGGKPFIEYYTPHSDSTQVSDANTPAIDRVWAKMNSLYPDADWIEVHPAESEHGAIAANANPDADTYWKMDYRYFDQYSLEEIPVDHVWGRFPEAGFGEKLNRMNYDIHVGAIAGLPGKFLAFCLSALIASLPITGFMIWWGRRKKSNAGKEKQVLTKKQTKTLVEA